MFKSELDYQTYSRNVLKVKEKVLTLGKSSAVSKEVVLGQFSTSKWLSLTDGKKGKHSIYNCKGCLNDDDLRSGLCLFPISKNDKKALKKAQEGGLFRLTKGEVQKETTSLVQQLNKQYRDNYKTTFDHQYRLCKGQKTNSEVNLRMKYS